MNYKYELYKEICAIANCCSNYKHEVEGFRFDGKSPIRWVNYILESAKKIEQILAEKELNMNNGEE